MCVHLTGVCSGVELVQHDQHIFDRSTLEFHTAVCVVPLLCTVLCHVWYIPGIHRCMQLVLGHWPPPVATLDCFGDMQMRESTRFLVEQHWHAIHENIVFGVRMLCIQLVSTGKTSVSVCWNVIVRLYVCAFVVSPCTCGYEVHLRQRWSCSRGASCVMEYTMGRLRDWSL